MRPGFVENDCSDGSLAHAVLGCQRPLAYLASGVFHTDFFHLRGGQRGVPVFRSTKSRLPHSAFLERVAHVVFMSSEEQMRRVAACPIIAMVADAQSKRNGPTGNRPSDSVSQPHPARSSIKSKRAIAANAAVGCPVPALIRSRDAHLAPEPKDVLRAQRRDATMFCSHDSLLERDSWSERLAARPQAVRFMGQYTREAA